MLQPLRCNSYVSLRSHLIKFPICVLVYNTVSLSVIKIFLHKINNSDFSLFIINATLLARFFFLIRGKIEKIAANQR